MSNKKYPFRVRLAATARQKFKNEKKEFFAYIILRTIVIAALVLSIIRQDIDSAFICLLVLVLYMIPDFIERTFKMELPTTLEIVILVFIFAAEILGELSNYYIQFKHWDTILHITWGFLCAAVGYSLIDLFDRDEHFGVKLSPLFLSIFAFCFSMTIGVFWEFFEFAADMLLRTDMQKDTVINSISTVLLDPTNSNKAIIINDISDVVINGESLGVGGYIDIGLFDTMEDLFVNFIGAFVFCVICYIGRSGGTLGRFARSFIPRIKGSKEISEDEEQLYEEMQAFTHAELEKLQTKQNESKEN